MLHVLHPEIECEGTPNDIAESVLVTHFSSAFDSVAVLVSLVRYDHPIPQPLLLSFSFSCDNTGASEGVEMDPERGVYLGLSGTVVSLSSGNSPGIEFTLTWDSDFGSPSSVAISMGTGFLLIFVSLVILSFATASE